MACEQTVLPDASAITLDWLTGVLRAAGSLSAGAPTSLEIEPLRSKPISELVRLRIGYDRDASGERPASIVLKIARPGAANTTMRRRRWKEHEFYAAIAPAMPDPPTPRAYAAVWDRTSGRSHLALQDLSESHKTTPRGLPPTEREAEAAVDCLAAIHAAWWDHPDLRHGLETQDGRSWHRGRAGAARRLVEEFVNELGNRISGQTRHALVQVAETFPALLAEAASGPVTIVHGDSHPWNFLHPVADGGRTILLDWESWTIDPGPNDLVALIAMRSLPDLRREREQPLVARYHAALRAAGVAGYSWEDCWNDYRRGIARRLIAPLRLRRAGSNSWQSCLGCLALAYHDLGCDEMLPAPIEARAEDDQPA